MVKIASLKSSVGCGKNYKYSLWQSVANFLIEKSVSLMVGRLYKSLWVFPLSAQLTSTHEVLILVMYMQVPKVLAGIRPLCSYWNSVL